MRTHGHTALVLVAVTLIVFGVAGRVERVDGPARAPAPAHCAPAAFHTFEPGVPVAIDEIRVVVDDGSPGNAAARVRVASGPFDRVVPIRGDASKSVSFFPALRGRAFDVSVDPVFTAPAGSCIERIELRHGGAPVVTLEPGRAH